MIKGEQLGNNLSYYCGDYSYWTICNHNWLEPSSTKFVTIFFLLIGNPRKPLPHDIVFHMTLCENE
jgi:hypothetical protein